MKKQLITPLILILGLATIAQPSFAMKRNRRGNTADQLSSAISSIVLAVRWFLARQPGALEYDNPYSFRPNHITFVSQSGTHFNVVANDLETLLHLSRSIATLLSDLVGSDISTIPLPNVHDSALYLLTQMASGADHEGLLDYIRSLSLNEIDRLKDEARFLDSQALQDLISRAIDEPITWLPPELLHLILAKVGPNGRSSCASADQTLHGAVTTVRKPVTEGGLGCTDTLPIVATILGVGHSYQPPVAHGQMLYISGHLANEIYVIDTRSNQLVATIKVGDFPLQPVVHGQMLHVVNTHGGTISVIDTNTNQVVATLQVGRQPGATFFHGHTLYVSSVHSVAVIDTNTNLVVTAIDIGGEITTPFLVHGQMLYVVNYGAGTVTVIDFDSNQIVATLQVGTQPTTAVVHDHKLYVANRRDGTVSVIDTNTNQIVATILVGHEPSQPVVHGQMLYVANSRSGTVSVIDANTNQVVGALPVGRYPLPPVVHDQMLYVANNLDSTVSVIDTKTNQVVQTIDVGAKPQELVVHGQMLFVVNKDDQTLSMIDTGTNQVVATIAVDKFGPRWVFIHGGMLYLQRGDRTVWVIDLGGYLPGQL